ncbi:MAG: glycosyltransferase [Fimbriimonadaceae bacterium]|nr:glycosyltransferase [Fimbriimonadaceae bacterium]
MSVLLTSYNHLPYLKQAVQSVQDQIFRDFELIILDDGSTDGSREWIQQEVSDARVFFSPSNLGTYGILNQGLAIATGEWIAVLNDDDLWKPGKVEAQMALADAEPRLGLIGACGDFIDEAGQTIEANYGNVYQPLPPQDAFTTLILENVFITSSVLFRRSALGNETKFDDSLYGLGDHDLWLRIAEHWWCAKAEGDWVSYRFHGAQASKREARMVEETERLEERTYRDRGRILKDRPTPEMRSALALLCSRVGTQRMWRGDRAGAREAYGASLELDPKRKKTKLRLVLTVLPPSLFKRLR